MSNRTLIEINHDYTGSINRDQVEFVHLLMSYLRSGSKEAQEILELQHGLKFFGMQHHSDGYDIRWAGKRFVQGEKGMMQVGLNV